MCSNSFFAPINCQSFCRITFCICWYFVSVLSSEPAPPSGHFFTENALTSLNRDASTVLFTHRASRQRFTSLQVLTLDLYRELWSRRSDGMKAPPASGFAASTRPACTYQHRFSRCTTFASMIDAIPLPVAVSMCILRSCAPPLFRRMQPQPQCARKRCALGAFLHLHYLTMRS
jgi:hypothetical protein